MNFPDGLRRAVLQYQELLQPATMSNVTILPVRQIPMRTPIIQWANGKDSTYDFAVHVPLIINYTLVLGQGLTRCTGGPHQFLKTEPR